jgi:hypothetical protein
MLSRLRHLVKHEWSEWSEPEQGSCAQQRRCTHCGLLDTPRVLHDWYERRYLSETTCQQIRTCQRCGQDDSYITTEHSYPPRSNACEEDVTCLRCGAVEYKTGHDLFPEGGGYDTCRRCGESFRTSVMG